MSVEWFLPTRLDGVRRKKGHDAMIRILSAGLLVTLLFACTGNASAQSSQDQAEPSTRLRVVPSERVQDSAGGEFYETSLIESPTLAKQSDLFTLMFRTGIVFRARCHYVVYDPCPDFSYLFRNMNVASSLAQQSQSMMNRMLEERGILEELEALTIEGIRNDVLRQREVTREPVDPTDTTEVGVPGEATGTDGAGPPPLPFRPPDSRRVVLGTAMFAGGGLLSASKNQWSVDEGYIGVGIAAVGLVLVFKEMVPEWRGLRIDSSGANLSIGW